MELTKETRSHSNIFQRLPRMVAMETFPLYRWACAPFSPKGKSYLFGFFKRRNIKL